MHEIPGIPRICRTPKASPEEELRRVRASFDSNDANVEQDLDMCMNSHGPQQENTGMVGLTAVPDAHALIDDDLITMDIKYRNPDHIKARGGVFKFELNRASLAMKQIRRGYKDLQPQRNLTGTQCSEVF